MGNKSEDYKKVFDPTNWPMDTKDIPSGIRMLFGISGFAIAALASVIGVVLIGNDYLVESLIAFLFACVAVGVGIYHIRAAKSKNSR